jgi:hypothetical protein
LLRASNPLKTSTIPPAIFKEYIWILKNVTRRKFPIKVKIRRMTSAIIEDLTIILLSPDESVLSLRVVIRKILLIGLISAISARVQSIAVYKYWLKSILFF